jgi:putative transposase
MRRPWSDAEWTYLAPYVPPTKPGGRPPKHMRRELVNAIFYLIRSGEAWRLLPHDLPPWRKVYHYFRLWRLDGTWERIHTALRERLRGKLGRNMQPSAAILDSQSVKTTGVGGERGYDGAKKLNGRKRHLLVDTQGLVLRAKVHRADLPDRAAVSLVLAGIRDFFPRIAHRWTDQGYNGTGKSWIEEQLRWTVEIVRHPPKPRGIWAPIDAVIDWEAIIPKGFRGVLPRRWVVERTFGWLLQSRRLSKDYERLSDTSEALIYATLTRLMARRLARPRPFSDSF